MTDEAQLAYDVLEAAQGVLEPVELAAEMTVSEVVLE